MAHGGSKGQSKFLQSLFIFFVASRATPEVAFPFNSQVPTVARVDQPYEFRFSASTFAPETANFTYSLSNQPTWLSVDSATRTLSGAPSQADVGASDFTLTAADSSGAVHIGCTLVVSSDPAPEIEWNIGQQLATSANLSSSHPPVATILPSSSFHFEFRQDSFIDIVERELRYYATLTDHTPLPSWLIFDPQKVSFSGTAPQLSAFPQSWDIDLIASDVEGFAGAAASFTLAVGTHQFVFVPEEREVHISADTPLDYEGLADALFSNGEKVDPNDLKSAQASMPSWLSFDISSLSLTGTAPSDVVDSNVTITVTDELGNSAVAVVKLVAGAPSIFTESIGTLSAEAGETFDYHLSDSLFSDQDVSLTVFVPPDAGWLTYNADSLTLSGKVPVQPSASTIEGEITASSPNLPSEQTQTFTINVKTAIPTTVASTDASEPTKSSVTETTHFSNDGEDDRQLSTGAVAGIIAGTVSAAAILVLLLVLCLRRRRQRRRRRSQEYVERGSPADRNISRPIPPLPDADAMTVTTDVHTDIEKQQSPGYHKERQPSPEPAPQIALDLPSQPSKRRMKWSKRFSRISQVSSLGNGEDTIRADSNIPELGTDNNALQTPHDSFSVPAEIARTSRQLSDMSPGKRALHRLKEKGHQSRQSIGLGIDTGGVGIFPRHSSRRARSHRRPASSLGISTIQDRNSLASISTRNTSVLSTKASDFPRPPTRSTFTRSIPGLSMTEGEIRRSIRFVDRSDSAADARSLQDKRQSFIRNRASTSFASPLFAHGKRTSSNQRQNGSGSGSLASSRRRSKHGKSLLSTYSESSSVEPHGRDSHRLSTKVRSTFAPSFPRAITRSSLGADDERATRASSEFYTTSSSISEADLTTELALPRHQRSWVLPGEASPTPPPTTPTSRQASGGHKTAPSNEYVGPRQLWKERLGVTSSSPLSTAVAVTAADRSSLSATAKSSQARKTRLSEPLSLVSNDSLHKAKIMERPRIVYTNSRRPVSVEKAQRLSSLRAETEDVRPGSEMWEAMEEAGLMPPNSSDRKSGTQKSNLSGAAFL